MFGSASNLLFRVVVRAIVAFTALPLHEASHAYVASKLGDDTARNQGRLTLNPMVHLDLMGTILLLFAGFGWAKPVPINPRNFKNPKAGMALSSLAGPVSNVLLAYVLLLIYKLLVISGIGFVNSFTSTFLMIINIMLTTNIYLAVFNLLPIPPLDGSRILFYFLPTKYYFKIMQYEQYIMIAVFVVLITGVLDVPLGILASAILRVLDLASFFLGRIL